MDGHNSSMGRSLPHAELYRISEPAPCSESAWGARELIRRVHGSQFRFREHRRSNQNGLLQDIEHLLDSGVKISLMYGDRDYACNWIGGEEASLHVKSSSNAFRNAGYAPIAISPFHSGGQVRQHGNPSFSRVYQAGHMGLPSLFVLCSVNCVN